MSDISGPLKTAIATALRGDAGVLAAFGMSPVLIFDIPPVDASPPYITLGPVDLSPIQAEGFDLSEIDYPVHVWSLTSPPSLDEAAAISAAIQAVLPDVTVTTGGVVCAIEPRRVTYLIDPSDGRTVHAVLTFRFTTAPA